MTGFSDPIQDIFGESGTLARFLEGFESRPLQMEMAQLTLHAIETKQRAIIEAGTGTGKTLGYLVPLVLSGKRAIISTGTKNLQDQIFFKDIPLLASATGRKMDAMIMKGRKNYLCLHRYHQVFSQTSFLRPDLEAVKKRIEKWMKRTVFADRGELPWMRDDDPIWDALSSSSEQCLGTKCLHWENCYLSALRRRASQAMIIIVNHHLFFADLLVRRSGFGEILPPFQGVVFDEAHNLEEIATTYFGRSVSTRQLLELVGDLEHVAKDMAAADRAALARHMDLIRAGAVHLSEILGEGHDRGRLEREKLRAMCDGPAGLIGQGLKNIHAKTELRGFKDTSLQSCIFRAEELDRSLEAVLTYRETDWLNWYEKRKTNLVLHASPLDISSSMDEMLYREVKTLVFTSATLSTNGNFDYFRSRLGLSENVIQGIYSSHFEFEKQTLLYIPRDMPLPSAPEFGQRIAERIVEILKITSGRALVLFTSHQNLNLVHPFLPEKVPYTVFKQGEAPKSILLEAFKRDTHSVLLATGSFWQGVDVPGEALSCLIIDKLPFDSPGDPLVAARIASIRTRGGNPFMEYQLPSAIISLKQGLGRLIRNNSDRGVLCVLDIRLVSSRYGQFFFKSLPKIRVTPELTDIGDFLENMP